LTATHDQPGDPVADITIYHNPRCSKSRGAVSLLEEQGIEAHVVEYLKDGPTRPEIEQLLFLLGFDDPRSMMRVGDDAYRELALADATRDELVDAMAAHPILIERPIVVAGNRAIIARPPERVAELF
jgi:arsenate reductase